jgi:Flp pilus assembly CpaE family ATPase
MTRVLVVEDNPADARLVEEMLRDAAPGEFELTLAESLAEAIGRAAEAGFDVALLDLRLPESQGIDTFRRLRARVPDLPIIVVTGLADTALGVTAVQEGAQDYLVKGQIAGESLARAIRYALVRSRTQAKLVESLERTERGRVLGFVGAKGGVGTTMVALNVSAALARRDRSVIIAELMCHPAALSAYLGRTPVGTLAKLCEMSADQIGKREVGACLVQLSFGPRVLFGPQRADEAAGVGHEVAAAVVERLAETAQYVVLDLGSSVCAAVAAALPRCDYVAIVTQAGSVGTKMAGSTLEVLRSSGLDESRFGLVIVNRTPGVTPVNIEEYRADLGCDIVGVIPPDADGLYAAELRGRPLVLDQPESIASANLNEIAARLAADRVIPIRMS